MRQRRRRTTRTGTTAGFLALLLIATIGCTPNDEVATARTPTPEELASVTLVGILDTEVRLEDGRYEGAPLVEGGAARPTVDWVREMSARGDLDHDGIDEQVMVLASSGGGSGNFVHVAAVGARGPDVWVLGVAPVGDRPQLRALAIEDGTIRLDVVQQGPDDAACCPTQLARRSWTLKPGALVESDAQIEGTLSWDRLDGTEWSLARLDLRDASPPVSSSGMGIAGQRLDARAGCHRYDAEAEPGASPGDLRIGSLEARETDCAASDPKPDDRFLRRLEAVHRFGYWNGFLALSWRDEGGGGLLLFEPAS